MHRIVTYTLNVVALCLLLNVVMLASPSEAQTISCCRGGAAHCQTEADSTPCDQACLSACEILQGAKPTLVVTHLELEVVVRTFQILALPTSPNIKGKVPELLAFLQPSPLKRFHLPSGIHPNPPPFTPAV